MKPRRAARSPWEYRAAEAASGLRGAFSIGSVSAIFLVIAIVGISFVGLAKMIRKED